MGAVNGLLEPCVGAAGSATWASSAQSTAPLEALTQPPQADLKPLQPSFHGQHVVLNVLVREPVPGPPGPQVVHG